MILRAALFLLAAILLPAAMGRAAPAPDPAHTVLMMVQAVPDHYRPDSSYGGGYGDATGRAALTRTARRVARLHGLRLVSDWPMPVLGIDCFILAVPDGRAPAAVATEIAGEPGVAWAQPLQLYRTQGVADPLRAAQPAERLWRLSVLHRLATGRGVTVAVIDSRVDAQHPDLAGQVMTQADFVGGHGAAAERHGTEVAGVIAAKGDNGLGIVGVAPGTRLMALRACWEEAGAPAAVCDSLSLAKALQAAIERRARVVNLSLSGPYDLLLARLLDAGLATGATVVTAFDRAQPDGGFPASQPGVIAVTDRAVAGGGRTPYVAPGRDVPTTAPGGKWLFVNGSSFAAAHVSGLLALVRERDRSHAPAVLRVAGGGTIDACRTLGCPAASDRACAGHCGTADAAR